MRSGFPSGIADKQKQRNAAGIGRHGSLQPRRIAGQKRALAGKESEEAGRDEVIAEPLVFHGEQRRRHDDAHTVDGPQRLAQRIAGDKGARHA
ncbi:hypothetical protein [Mesorhizobium sp. M2C.T.Ca.TU.002.02.1.1]|uniref:hypothetical protein n=1 Tax=Mesorhizobium sp. M2C.T.Ca.TU.002.02.1.1 TaxID=2496788 RepID=UPI001FE1E1B8|nr:hypothetical protein [Mesorhizobium sp. M2C.T.Ca.TU.002.02.1.1]